MSPYFLIIACGFPHTRLHKTPIAHEILDYGKTLTMIANPNRGEPKGMNKVSRDTSFQLEEAERMNKNPRYVV